MHPTSVRQEFLRLRSQGLSLASIGRRLGASKPTLIKWNRQSQSEIAAQITANRQSVHAEIASATNQEITELTRRLEGLKQELFSRAVREISTPTLEALAGQLRQRLDFLQSNPSSAAASPHPCHQCESVVDPSPSEKLSISHPDSSEPNQTPKN